MGGMGGPQGIQQQLMEAMQAMQQQRGGSSPREQDPPMTLAVGNDPRVLIVSSTKATFLRVKEFVQELDTRASQQVTVTESVRLQSITPSMAQETLRNLLPEGTQIRTNQTVSQGAFGTGGGMMGGGMGGMMGGMQRPGGMMGMPGGTMGGGGMMGGAGMMGGQQQRPAGIGGGAMGGQQQRPAGIGGGAVGGQQQRPAGIGGGAMGGQQPAGVGGARPAGR